MTRSNITRILEREDNLLRIFDGLDTGIIAHDVDRRIFIFNEEAERITGFSKEEILGQDCHEFFGGALCGIHCSFCEGGVIMESTEPAEPRYSMTLLSRSGEAHQVQMTLTWLKGEDGIIWGVLASMRDMTGC